ncbi:MAG: Coenzyme F420 hydrogenase/dehydrogenase, beta subunit C-terminal domain [Oscillospiraceae bacterium]
MYLPEQKNKFECCGCGACMNICPVNAISMQEDEMGFCYPVKIKEKCINCRKCERICSFEAGKKVIDDYSTLAYGAVNKDEAIRSASRSGGVFTEISNIILDNGGTVYGCELTDDFNAVHTRATSCEERDKFRGSKYIQSDISDVYKQIVSDLEEGKQVMFSGTTCQVEAVRKYIEASRADSSNLYLVDIVCHGVPSKRVFHDYLKFIEKKNKCKVTGFNFRNKEKFGWKAHVETAITDKGEFDYRYFKNLFLEHDITRDSCFECPYRNTVRSGDISLADFWGINDLAPEMNDNKGISLILIHTDKGKALFEKCIDKFESRSFNSGDCLQQALNESYLLPKSRNTFWKMYKKIGFKWVIIDSNIRKIRKRILKK